MRFFRLDEPQSWHARPALPMAYDATMGLVDGRSRACLLGARFFGWPHTWGNGGDQAFVMATDRDPVARDRVRSRNADLCRARRPRLLPRLARWIANIRSAIDIVTEFQRRPERRRFSKAPRNNVTGLAVQVDGPLLFVAHGALSPARIHVLDKRSGRVARARSARRAWAGSSPCRAAMSFWAIHDGAPRPRRESSRNRARARTTRLKIVRTLAGVESPLALSCRAGWQAGRR